MTELEKWFADPNNPRELEAALNLPIIQKALTLQMMMNLPAGFTDGGAQESVTQGSHNWHYYAGFHDFPKKLKSLAVQLTGEDTSPLEAFDSEWLLEWAQKRQQPKTDQP